MNNRRHFKAKRKDNGKWVIGYLFFTTSNTLQTQGFEPCIQTFHDGRYSCAEVIEETICQCTGLKDKNVKLIFERDIVHEGAYDYEIFYHEFWGFQKVPVGHDREEYHSGLHTHESLEIKGNIHDE